MRFGTESVWKVPMQRVRFYFSILPSQLFVLFPFVLPKLVLRRELFHP